MDAIICGHIEKATVDTAVQYGASHVGFIMSEGFPRSVRVEQVRAMTADLPATIKKVGVFTNEPLDYVKRVMTEANLDIVQLDGNEDIDYIQALDDFPVIKTVSNDNFPEIITHEELKNLCLLIKLSYKGKPVSEVKLPYFILENIYPEGVRSTIKAFPDMVGVEMIIDKDSDLDDISSFIQRTKIPIVSEDEKIFEIDNIDAGWLDFQLLENGYFTHSYWLEFDLPKALIKGVCDLLEDKETQIWLCAQNEPGGWIIQISKEKNTLKMVYSDTNPDEVLELPVSEGPELQKHMVLPVEPKNIETIDIHTFAQALYNEFFVWSNEPSKTFYEQQWEMPFPSAELERLGKILLNQNA